MLDINNDGKISRAEWSNAWAGFDQNSLASIIHTPSLKERFLGSSSRLAKLTKVLNDRNSPSYENNDLRVVAQMVMARHITVDRMNHMLKPDAPLTISDVPMLISLMQAAPLCENLCCSDPFMADELPAKSLT